jgi:hypothetical protein
MDDLRTQLNDYFEHHIEPIDVDALPEMLHTAPLVPHGTQPPGEIQVVAPTKQWKGWQVAAAAAFAAVLLLGGIGMGALFARSTIPAADTPTTTVEALSTTTVTVVVAPTTIGQITIDVASSIVPGLGTLRWERIEGDANTLPAHGIRADSDGGYIAFEDDKVWRSTDGLTWVVGEDDGPFANSDGSHIEGEWARTWAGEASTLFHMEGDIWVPVDVEPAVLPDTVGITWNAWGGFPVESNGTTLVDANIHGRVSWGDVYGTFEIDCGQPDPCNEEPWGQWDEPSQTIRIENPTNGSMLGVLVVEVDGDTLTLVDTTSGETVHVVKASPSFSVALIMEGMMNQGQGLTSGGGWILTPADEFVWIEFPWSSVAEIVAVPDGGFAAYEFVYDWENQTNPLVAATTWTSLNGVNWVDGGMPPFIDVDGRIDHVSVTSDGGQISATVITGQDNSTGEETYDAWVSTDGVTWAQTASVFPPWSNKIEMDFGAVVTAMPESTQLFWVTTDGETWHQVEGPPGSHEPGGPGYSESGAAGSILYTVVGEDGGPRVLWIGRFESDL